MEPGNVLNIDSLTKNWRDKDSVILHASFQLLKDFVEKEDCDVQETDWDADERLRSAKVEIDELYRWWLSYIKTHSLDDEGDYELENDMLIRLIKVRWALWT